MQRCFFCCLCTFIFIKFRWFLFSFLQFICNVLPVCKLIEVKLSALHENYLLLDQSVTKHSFCDITIFWKCWKESWSCNFYAFDAPVADLFFGRFLDFWCKRPWPLRSPLLMKIESHHRYRDCAISCKTSWNHISLGMPRSHSTVLAHVF